MSDSMVPLTPEEQIEADRFAGALDALDAGRDPEVDPAEDPTLDELLNTALELRAAAEVVVPRPAYRSRSRALLVESVQPGLLRRVTRARAAVPFYSRRTFLLPLATAAAAAGFTIAAVLGASELGFGPVGQPTGGSGVAVSTAPDSPAAAPAQTTNLTQLSIDEDLRNLQATLDAVIMSAERGEDLDPRLLRSIAERNLMITSLLSESPDQLRTDEVISYYQTAADSTIKLNELALSADEPALVAAYGASQDGVFAAAAHMAVVQERLASGHQVQ